MKTRALALASFGVLAVVLGVASCKSFDAGYNAAACQQNSKDQASCDTCCKAGVPDGKGGKFSDKCHCVTADGREL